MRSIICAIFNFTLVVVCLTGCSLPISNKTQTPTPITNTPSSPTPITPTPAPPTPTPTTPTAARLIGYFYSLDRTHSVSEIPADKFSVLIDAFINVSAAGECVSIDPAVDKSIFKGLIELKKLNPELKTVLSVGGYAHSAYFSDAASSNEARRTFAQSCVAFMTHNGFDGIDIDWETPVSGGLPGNIHRPEDKQNFTALLSELRSELVAQGKADGKSYLLAAALPAGPDNYTKFELDKIHPYLDWITLMAYPFYTGDSKITNFNAPLFASNSDPSTNEKKRLDYNGDAAVRAYLAAGVPANKISLGVPFYGRAWKGVPPNNHGLYQTNTGVFVDDQAPKGIWSSEGEISYKSLERNYQAAWSRFRLSEAQVP
jgi:chitinase